MKLQLSGTFLLLGLILPSICPIPAGSDEFSCWKSATNLELDEIRGGFITDQGLPITFGYNETATINGVSVLNTKFNISQADVSALPYIKLIQSGANNLFPDPGNVSKNLAVLTAIQNTIDKQIINHATTIDISVTNQGLLRNMNLSNSLTHQMINGMR
jgi:hypothetical protein